MGGEGPNIHEGTSTNIEHRTAKYLPSADKDRKTMEAHSGALIFEDECFPRRGNDAPRLTRANVTATLWEPFPHLHQELGSKARHQGYMDMLMREWPTILELKALDPQPRA